MRRARPLCKRRSRLLHNGSQISEGKALKTKNLILKINIIMKTKMSNYRKCFALAYVLLAVVFFVGCEQDKTKSEVMKKEVKQEFYGQNIEIVVIDSCEYLYVSNGNASWGSHKGNCKFCLQRLAK